MGGVSVARWPFIRANRVVGKGQRRVDDKRVEEEMFDGPGPGDQGRRRTTGLPRHVMGARPLRGRAFRGPPPILDEFVGTHPEFSADGARGVLALTGFQGSFGERTQDRASPDWAASVQPGRLAPLFDVATVEDHRARSA